LGKRREVARRTAFVDAGQLVFLKEAAEEGELKELVENRFEIRVVSSCAAFSVKVTTRRVSAVAFLAFINVTTRSTSVKVLPEPGPAIINTGPSKCSIAFFWLRLADECKILFSQ
jgi:hypothetical protein